MSIAANADLVIDQGADFFVQLYWTDMNNVPLSVQAPMRMQIKADTGQVVQELIYQDYPAAGEPITIDFSPDVGLIQLSLEAQQTDNIPAGLYDYDLFVSYSDKQINPKIRLIRLLYGKVEVRGKVTETL